MLLLKFDLAIPITFSSSPYSIALLLRKFSSVSVITLSFTIDLINWSKLLLPVFGLIFNSINFCDIMDLSSKISFATSSSLNSNILQLRSILSDNIDSLTIE